MDWELSMFSTLGLNGKCISMLTGILSFSREFPPRRASVFRRASSRVDRIPSQKKTCAVLRFSLLFITLPKFDSSPLKSYKRTPIGSRIVFQQPFSGAMLNFGGVFLLTVCHRFVANRVPFLPGLPLAWWPWNKQIQIKPPVTFYPAPSSNLPYAIELEVPLAK